MNKNKDKCRICGKELNTKKDNFIKFPSLNVYEKGNVFGYEGRTYCATHGNYLNMFEIWMKNTVITDDNPVYAELNKIWYEKHEEMKNEQGRQIAQN